MKLSELSDVPVWARVLAFSVVVLAFMFASNGRYKLTTTSADVIVAYLTDSWTGRTWISGTPSAEGFDWFRMDTRLKPAE
ncbi:hypothetical protein N8642_02520 [bacterium]|nr:hypothetical protein [bacterium]